MIGHFVFTGQIQSQAMSHAKFIFLLALVVFFVTLFVAAYVWMRRPDFGQKGGHHPMPTASDVPAPAHADAPLPPTPMPTLPPTPMPTLPPCPRMTEGPQRLVPRLDRPQSVDWAHAGTMQGTEIRGDPDVGWRHVPEHHHSARARARGHARGD